MTVTPRVVFADCAPVRPATAEEKKIIKALRQVIPAEGSHPGSADFMVVMGAPVKGPRNVVLISGDQARAEALLKASKLQ